MRILLINPQNFFDEITLKGNISLKKLSKKLKLNYSTIKKYRRGEKTLPKLVFDKLTKISPNRNYWIKNKKELSDNWGAVKGGINSMKYSDKASRLEYVRSFRKIVKINLKKNERFCEFYGALLGDGCMSRFIDSQKNERFLIQLTGNLRLDKEYVLYLKELLEKEYKICAYYYERKIDSCCILVIKNKELLLLLNKRFEVPIGLKYNKLKLSTELLNLPWIVKKYIVRGLFDTDGCIFAKKNEGYRYPQVGISSKNKSFLNQLADLLKEQGYPAYVGEKDVCVRGIGNVKRWFEDIGSSNPRNINKYQYFLKHGHLPARLGL